MAEHIECNKDMVITEAQLADMVKYYSKSWRGGCGAQNVSIEEYLRFMYTPKNKYRCGKCPERREHGNLGAGFHLQCGQQNCWVVVHCVGVKGEAFNG